MYRLAMADLKEWRKGRHKPLLILGARQTGKSWLMDEFGRQNYKSVIHIELENIPELQGIFEKVTDPERIFHLIEIYAGQKIDPETTLVILDEIQETPNALTALKYIQEKAPQYHVMAAGSYLGTGIHKKASFPVGKVDILELKPMSFYEFLLACNEAGMAQLLKEGKLEDAEIFASRLTDFLKYYYFVGGMPECVETFVKTRDLNEVRKIQNNLLLNYRLDFSKHVPQEEIARVNQIWGTLAGQLAKENRKFVYSQIKKGARSKEYETAIQWLTDTGLVHQVFRIDKPDLPLSAYRDDKAFKLYFLDVGLLGAMAHLQPETILKGSELFTEFKGALSEQYVLQELVIQTSQIYYWSAQNSVGEVDFITADGNEICPIEVKSGMNVRSKSLRSFIEKFRLNEGFRFSLQPYRKQDWLINYPLYAAGEFFSLLKHDEEPFLVELP